MVKTQERQELKKEYHRLIALLSGLVIVLIVAVFMLYYSGKGVFYSPPDGVSPGGMDFSSIWSWIILIDMFGILVTLVTYLRQRVKEDVKN